MLYKSTLTDHATQSPKLTNNADNSELKRKVFYKHVKLLVCTMKADSAGKY